MNPLRKDWTSRIGDFVTAAVVIALALAVVLIAVDVVPYLLALG